MRYFHFRMSSMCIFHFRPAQSNSASRSRHFANFLNVPIGRTSNGKGRIGIASDAFQGSIVSHRANGNNNNSNKATFKTSIACARARASGINLREDAKSVRPGDAAAASSSTAIKSIFLRRQEDLRATAENTDGTSAETVVAAACLDERR